MCVVKGLRPWRSAHYGEPWPVCPCQRWGCAPLTLRPTVRSRGRASVCQGRRGCPHHAGGGWGLSAGDRLPRTTPHQNFTKTLPLDNTATLP